MSEGWDREDYPSERVRSKVTFHHPKEKGLSIGVTGGPKPNPSYTLSDYDTEAHEKLPAMQAQAPGTSWAINRRTLGGREFVVVSSKDAGAEFAVLITNVAYYNLSFKYLTRKQYEIYHKDFVHFVESFLPLDTKQFSPSEVRAALADRAIGVSPSFWSRMVVFRRQWSSSKQGSASIRVHRAWRNCVSN
jgi:hypothetical protein